MKFNLQRCVFVAAGLLVIALVAAASGRAQDSPQKDAAYAAAIDAHDLDGAKALAGKKGAFKGTVTQVFTPRSGAVAILNFDRQYKTALTAVVNKADWARFPDLTELVGKEVVISGKF